jgi:hypothetical protein
MTLFIIFGVNQKGLITNDVYFLNLLNASSTTANNTATSATTATWLNSFSINKGSGGATIDNNKGPGLSNQAIIGITIGSVLFLVVRV